MGLVGLLKITKTTGDYLNYWEGLLGITKDYGLLGITFYPVGILGYGLLVPTRGY